MTAITTLGVDNLSLRGASNEYNLITRLFTTKAEADAAPCCRFWFRWLGSNRRQN